MNLYKTIVANLYLFPLKTALKLPVIIYKNTQIYSLGQIEITCPVRRGLFHIGRYGDKANSPTKFTNIGKIIIDGEARILGGSIIINSGTIHFKAHSRISDECLVDIKTSLELGQYARIGYRSQVIDNDGHFAIDVTTKEVQNNRESIVIGNFNFIGSNTYIKKGVRTPDSLIVASANALLTKDYTDLPPYSIIGGTPAKLIKVGNTRRIYNMEEEKMLNEYFKENNEKYKYDDDIDVDQICRID